MMKNIIKGLLIAVPFFVKAQTNQDVNKALQMNTITTTMPFLNINPDKGPELNKPEIKLKIPTEMPVNTI